MVQKKETNILRLVSAGNFLLGFCLFSYGYKILLKRVVEPILALDSSGGATLYYWAGPLLLLWGLIGIVGGILTLMLARVVHRSRWRIASFVTSALGFVVFVEQIREVVFAALVK